MFQTVNSEAELHEYLLALMAEHAQFVRAEGAEWAANMLIGTLRDSGEETVGAFANSPLEFERNPLIEDEYDIDGTVRLDPYSVVTVLDAYDDHEDAPSVEDQARAALTTMIEWHIDIYQYDQHE